MNDKEKKLTEKDLMDLCPATPTLYGDDAKAILADVLIQPTEPVELRMDELKKHMERVFVNNKDVGAQIEFIPQMYQMIADEDELHWFFDHVIMRPQVNESYSAVFVSRHKKLTKEEQEQFGLTRKEAEFLATQTFKMRNIKDGSSKDDPELWTFEQFLQRVKRFNVDKGAYTTSTGLPIPQKTLAVIFYVNPGDDMKVCKKFVEEYNNVNEAISKAMLNGKTTAENYQSYQWFGNAESNIKHLKANQKGSRYWMDFDIDVPKWFKGEVKKLSVCGTGPCSKEEENHVKELMQEIKKHNAEPEKYANYNGYLGLVRMELDIAFGKGNYVIIDTSGGYHILVKTSAIRCNPNIFCKRVEDIYNTAVKAGMEPYLDDKGNCKFECIVNDSQIPGLPLPGTYQYGRPVTVLNKEDFE